VDLGSLLSQALEVTRPRWKDEAQRRGAAIEAAIDLEPVPPVLGNAAELRETLVNLIFNAVDAMPQGGRLTLAARRGPAPAAGEGAAESVEVSVRDTGAGMSEEVRRRAFDPFFTTKGVKGTGLGLSMVYGIVTRLRGDVRLESREGAGTTVILRLPAAGPTAPAPAAEEPALPPAVRRGRIVVVDDEEPLARLLADMLRVQDHEVAVFTDPRFALEHLAQGPADLLFTDLGMPEMSRWDVARCARELHPNLPVILVTGWGHQTDPAEACARHVARVVPKPYRMATILQITADFLNP
jgi:CheY-like chemotaxis protein